MNLPVGLPVALSRGGVIAWRHALWSANSRMTIAPKGSAQ